jgi:uncharacterized phage protein (TIGR01671 family)
MKEIKFRAYKSTQKMYQVQSVNFHSQTGEAYSVSIDFSPYTVRISDIELMQFTGLMDKNGKEIYEGDVVRVNAGEPSLEFISQVIFEQASFRIAAVYDQGFPHKEDIEVIGNIYEHPELVSTP